jgi:hypothetical protein
MDRRSMDEVERAWQLRRELGRELKTLRQAAGLSQPHLAGRTGYSRSTIATLESTNGGAVARAFWEKSDAVFGTGDRLARRWDDIQQHVQAARALTAAARRRPGPRRRAIAGTTHLQALRTLRSAGADPDGVPQARMACAQLGWPVVSGGARPELVTGTVIDALQIPRAAGQLAISWWLDTGGTADPVRRLPAMPRPDQALAVISVGGSCYFLARAGACPWPAAGPAPDATRAPAGGPPPDGTRAAGPIISWHSHGSRVPLPPGRAADGDPAQWAHLPSQGVSLASPVALLELLAKALSVIRGDTQALSLPGGVLAVPARHPVLPPAHR